MKHGIKRKQAGSQPVSGDIEEDDKGADAVDMEDDGKAVGSVDLDSVGDGEEGFDLKGCGNTSIPVVVEWDNAEHSFVDGFGLCSHTRWKPKHRGQLRDAAMVKLANDTFSLLKECVLETIGDVKRDAFRLVTGKITTSPFSEDTLGILRRKLAALFI